ncbi:hypothetical protein [Enterococcus wangshanyuanii]|uniref:Uncharacterized protein n=1 Tax=Enterococcus wangshanyuanii TaxID=2005703 RepID=A0ABQ1PW02_9ENTE|nr:hypothetical protein [Enterococcus wangshanyuanii]GGD05498.1 hypothetical protein GCM10011573_38670 [Enterococcus wangshanyuanii]
MARQSNSNRKGFSPQNLLAGLDTELDNDISPTDKPSDNDELKETIDDQSKNDMDKKEKDDNLTDLNSLTEEQISENNADTVEELDHENEARTDKIQSQRPSETTNIEEPTRPSLDDLVNKVESKKAQENVYLHEDVKDDLEVFGKLIGKNNGGKSFVVETALLEYFERNSDYLEIARSKYGKKKKR